MGNVGNCKCSTGGGAFQDADEPSPVVAHNEPDLLTKLPAGFAIDEDASIEQRLPSDAADHNGTAIHGATLRAEDPDMALKNFTAMAKQRSSDEGEVSEAINEEAITFSRQVSAVSSHADAKLTRLASQRGFFVELDDSPAKVVAKTGSTHSAVPVVESKEALSDTQLRVITNPCFESSQVLGVFISPTMMERCIGDEQLAKYLEDEKKLVPFMNIKNGLMPQTKGVQLIEENQLFQDSLQSALDAGVHGVKINAVVKQGNTEGIRALVDQQFQIAKRIIQMGLLPVLHIVVDIKASTKNKLSREAVLAERRKSEEILFDRLLAGLGNLQADEQVMFNLSLPTKANAYLSLVGHPNTVRVMASPVGYNLRTACQVLERNFGLVGCFGNLLLEGMSPTQSEDEFTSVLQVALTKVFSASVAVPTKEMQTTKVACSPGFFACLDYAAEKLDSAMMRYRLGKRSEYSSKAAAMAAVHEMRSRILSNTKFSGSRVIAVLINEDTMGRSIHKKPSAKYVWEEKQVVPFLSLDHGLMPEKDGVQVVKESPKLDEILNTAATAGIYGIKMCSVIKQPDAQGIRAAVEKHISLSMKIMEKELVPVMHLEVDKDTIRRAACEELILDILGSSLAQFRPEQKVILWLAPPINANKYLPLRGHPSVIRIVFVSGGRDRVESCRILQQNFETIGGFNRAFVEGMHFQQTEEELSAMVDESCQAIFESSRSAPAKSVQAYKVAKQEGFFVGLANLASITKFSVVTNPQFNSLHIIGVTMTPDQLDIKAMTSPLAKYIWEEKQMVPFMHIDIRGLSEEANGVQLMREFPQHERDGLLDKAINAGIFGITAVSKIRNANSKGIHDAVEQQFVWAKDIMARGLVPLMKLFVDQDDPVEKEKCERTLRLVVGKALRSLGEQDAVMLNFVLPSTRGFYDCFCSHPNVLRVLGTPGNYSFETSCEILSA